MNIKCIISGISFTYAIRALSTIDRWFWAIRTKNSITVTNVSNSYRKLTKQRGEFKNIVKTQAHLHRPQLRLQSFLPPYLCLRNLVSHGNEGLRFSASLPVSPLVSTFFPIILYASRKARATIEEVIVFQISLAIFQILNPVFVCFCVTKYLQ